MSRHATPTPAPTHEAASSVVPANDQSEHEADRAANTILRGGTVAGWSLGSQPLAGHSIQRQTAGGEKSDEDKLKEAGKKTLEAIRKTKQAKALEKKVLEHPTVKRVQDAATSPYGIAALATAGVAGFSYLAATGKELPFQPPEIPLDVITPGLSGKVTYTGPVNRPTFVGLSLTYKEQGPKGKAGPSDKERFRAETARMAAEQAKFRQSLRYAPGSKEAEDQRLADEAVWRYVVSQSGPLGIPGLVVPLKSEPVETKKQDEPVQRSARTGTGSGPATARVGEALTSPGRPLEAGTRRSMETRFGHDFSRVRLHDDASSAASAASLDATAYTVGNDIVLGSGDLDMSTAGGVHLLAHELAHVVQQRRGPEARHIARYTAFSNTDQRDGSSGGWRHPSDEDLRVSDDGQMAVEDKGWNEGTNKRAWTTPKLIGIANSILTGQKSRAKLRRRAGGNDIHGAIPRHAQSSNLVEVEPFKPDGSELDLASDCGTAAREVMGSRQPGSGGLLGGAIGSGVGVLSGAGAGAGIGFLAGGPVGAVIGGIIGAIAGGIGGFFAGKTIAETPGREERDVAALEGAGTGKESYLTPRTYHGGDPTTPEEWSEELFKKEFGSGLTRQEAYRRYAALTPAGKKAFARKYGVNEYARPRIGQGITVSTETKMPGFGFVGDPRDSWNFHYAAAVLSSSDDYVTLENAAGWNPKNWIWYMYGPARRTQSFHEEHLAMGSHGTIASSYVVQPERLLDLTVGPNGAQLTMGSTSLTLDRGTRLRVLERLGSGQGLRYRVRVVDRSHAGRTGLVTGGQLR
jgi:hypothetical protein